MRNATRTLELRGRFHDAASRLRRTVSSMPDHRAAAHEDRNTACAAYQRIYRPEESRAMMHAWGEFLAG